jgi:hypothetical protein
VAHHPDLDCLFDYLLKFAQQMLNGHGEFYPFSAAITADGQLQAFGATDGTERSHPRP